LTLKAKAKDLGFKAKTKNMINESKAKAIQNTSLVIIRSYCNHWQIQNSTKSCLCLNVWVSLVLGKCLHRAWLVLSHITEYHFKALTTTSSSHTDQTLCLSTLAFQTSYAQHHVVCRSKCLSRSRPCNSHLPLPAVLGCRAVMLAGRLYS